MGQILHGSATTTHAIRAAIQRSKAAVKELATQYGLDPKTVAKWKKRIDVYDTGVGMAPEHLPQIFEAFHRLDSTRADGLGIGLFVVRRAVELLGHRVEVRSQAGRGSRFSVFARPAG